MPTTITGSPLGPFGDAVLAALSPDGTLSSLAPGGTYASLPRDRQVPYPYVIVGARRELLAAVGAMQMEGSTGRIWVDVWSDHDGPVEAQAIQARIRVLLLRQTLPVQGFSMIAGSLVCPTELCFSDVDTDLPTRSLYHGVQEWTADLEEAI